MEHMAHIDEVVKNDIDIIRAKEKTYLGSWKKRESGVFHITARMWDRIENITQGGKIGLFDIIRDQNYGIQDGEMLAIIADLRRYLLLIEAQMRAEAAGDPVVSSEMYAAGLKAMDPEWKCERAKEREMKIQGALAMAGVYDEPSDFNTEEANDRPVPGSRVPANKEWLIRDKIPLIYNDFYIKETPEGPFQLKRNVTDEQYKRMPHDMQALYGIAFPGFQLLKAD